MTPGIGTRILGLVGLAYSQPEEQTATVQELKTVGGFKLNRGGRSGNPIFEGYYQINGKQFDRNDSYVQRMLADGIKRMKQFPTIRKIDTAFRADKQGTLADGETVLVFREHGKKRIELENHVR